MTKVTWTQLKQIIINNSIPYTWIKDDNSYTISGFNGPLELLAIIPVTDPASIDQLDFETNYKANGNKSIVTNTNIQSQPPYGSKIININGSLHNLYTRHTGIQYPVIIGSNTLTYTVSYPWIKLIGVECINCQALDTVDFAVYDDNNGTYSGTPNALLQQFAFSLNLPKDFYQKMAQFDADAHYGMVITLTYISQSIKIIGINFLYNQVL